MAIPIGWIMGKMGKNAALIIAVLILVAVAVAFVAYKQPGPLPSEKPDLTLGNYRNCSKRM